MNTLYIMYNTYWSGIKMHTKLSTIGEFELQVWKTWILCCSGGGSTTAWSTTRRPSLPTPCVSSAKEFRNRVLRKYFRSLYLHCFFLQLSLQFPASRNQGEYVSSSEDTVQCTIQCPIQSSEISLNVEHSQFSCL